MSENILSKSHYGKLLYNEDKQFYENIYANMQISVSLVSKAMGTDRLTSGAFVKLPLNSCVKKISISSNIYSFGHKCTLILGSTDDNITKILENGDTIHCVINIAISTSIEDENSDGTSPFIQVEPYIFEILEVQTIKSGNKIDTFLITMCDIFAATAKKHSWASIIKWYPSITTATSYTAVISCIFGYIKDVISYETNKAYIIEKDFYYEEDKFSSEKIVAMTIKRIKSGASIYEALEEIWKDLSTSFEYPSAFSSSHELFEGGEPVVRAILQDEYSDGNGYYLGGLQKESSSSSGVDLVDLKRNMCLRTILSPFKFAFAGGKNADVRGMVWDVVNPPDSTIDNDPIVYPMGTGIYTYSPINNFIKYPISPKIACKGWKNYVFQTETVGGASGGKGQFIFYNWVHSLFNFSFLNISSADDHKNEFVSYIIPGFAALETDEDRGTGSVEGEGNLNFNEANTVVKPIKTEDFEQEVLLNIGKELTSLVLWANEYSFEIKGSLCRRPNELIKIYSRASSYEDENLEISNSQIISDTYNNPYIYVYLTSVEHIFDTVNNSYINKCYAVRPCTYFTG